MLETDVLLRQLEYTTTKVNDICIYEASKKESELALVFKR